MLKDRRVLLEQEIVKLHQEAASMYLNLVRTNSDLLNNSYQELRERISSLEFDLNIVNQLIYKGHE
jgi:hypothetical protein